MIKIQPLTNISIESIHKAFQKAFEDYEEPFDLTVQQLQYMIERRGFRSNLSFGAFDKDELVGFTLNGIGKWQNKTTAYDTGTGIIKSYRKQGLATRIFEESLPILKQNGITQYLLEVIKTNTKAFDLYQKAGFVVLREFDYFVSPVTNIKMKAKAVNFRIQELDKPEWEKFSSFWDFHPSWQNSIESIERKLAFFKFIGIFDGEKMIGYGIIEPHTGDIPQFAIAKNYRRKGLGTTLFDWFVKTSESGTIKIINTDFKNKGTMDFMQSMNLKPGFGQYEMLLPLK